MENTNQSKSHAVFNIKLHIVFVTKYRRKTLTPEVLDYLKEAFSDCLTAWNCKLVEYGGEPDHAHGVPGIVLPNTSPSSTASLCFGTAPTLLAVLAALHWKQSGPMWTHKGPKSTPESPLQRQKPTASARPPPDDSAHALMPLRGHLA